MEKLNFHRILMAFVSMIMVCGYGFAQSESGPTCPFEVQAPTWTKLVTPNPSQSSYNCVNIRKAPSATAPRLVYDESKITSYQVPLQEFAYWSATPPKGSVSALQFCENDYAPLLEESDGWYEIGGKGPNGESGWVSSKFCHAVEVEEVGNLTPDEGYLISNLGGDEYVLYMHIDEMDGYVECRFGKKADGKIISPYALTISDVTYDDAPDLKKYDDYYSLVVTQDMFTDAGEFILTKMPGELINKIIVNMVKLPSPSITCRVDGNLITF